MKIIVDADACPVKNIIKETAVKYSIPVVMVCDTSHIITDDYCKVIGAFPQFHAPQHPRMSEDPEKSRCQAFAGGIQDLRISGRNGQSAPAAVHHSEKSGEHLSGHDGGSLIS